MGLPILKKSILAAATTLALMGWSLDAQALALGAITVRSALGEPLRAEIEIPEMNSDEAATLQANLGSAQAFRAAGVDYSPALSGAQITLQKRPGGQSYLRILGSRPVNDPILGVVIEASWAGGRIVRDYALLLDPPGRDALPAVVATAPKVVTAPATAAPPRPTVAEQTTRSARTAEPRAGAAAAGHVTVNKGDTASRIAAAHALDGVSLEQMLLAMLQANPKAFIRGNVNLIRAGAVLQMPSAEQAQATSRTEARRTVVAQTRDFQDYRHALAQNAPAQQVSASSGRSVSGRVQAQVQEQRAAPASGDKVEVSAPGTASTSSESQTATTRQQQADVKRTEELSTNIKQLQAAADATRAAAGTQEAAQGSAPGINIPAGTPTTATPTTPASAAVGPVATASEAGTAAAPGDSTSETASPAPTPTTTQPPEAPKPAPAPVTPAPIVGTAESTSFLDDLLENPLLPAGGAALILLLLGYGFYRTRQRKKEDAEDGYAQHSLQRDSFGRVSVGPDEDKREARKSAATSSVGSYSPSQINPDEVDPVAEADVYLAYGRDKQAEDILREALRATPKRIAIHRKLAEIYAKRRDTRALEAVANEAHGLAQPKDSDWQAIASLGTELDPDNPVYKPGGTPRPKPAPAERDEHQFGQDTMPESGHSDLAAAIPSDSLAVPLDLNLDLSDLAGRAANGSGPRSTAPGQGESTLSPTSGAPAMHPAIARSIRERPTEPIALDNDLVDLDLGLNAEPAASLAKAAATQPASDKEGQSLDMLDFNMEDGIDDSIAASVLETHQPPVEEVDDPLSTKLSLAQEFRAIGDREGARALAQEVATAATGALKAQAERLLAEL